MSPAEVFLCHADGSGERQLTDLNRAWKAEVALSQPQRLQYERAGYRLDCWVMKPYGFTSGQRYPAILNIHGGPHTQYGQTFFDEFQVYAGAGYVVIYTNPRGSQGYGEAFLQEVIGDWGGGDFADVMAGLDAAVRQCDFIDPARLGVLGGSYGGFLTSWIVGHTSRFKAACSERAVNNPYTLFGTSDIGHTFSEAESGYLPWENLQWYIDHAPLTYAKDITTPLLIMHAEDDLRCPIEQAEQLYIALKKQRKDVMFVRSRTKTTKCHGLASPATGSSGFVSFSNGLPGIYSPKCRSTEKGRAMELELTDRVAIVTGGSKGIGQAVARELAREGAQVVIAARHREALEDVARALAQDTGRRIIPVPTDTTDRESVEHLIKATLEACGRVDILVNNAATPGGLVRGDLAQADDTALLEDINTKVVGYFRCAKAVAPHMQQRGWGRIINIGGLSGRRSGVISGLRNAAVVHLTKTLADQLGQHGITVNLIHPGATRTERTGPGYAEQARREGVSCRGNRAPGGAE